MEATTFAGHDGISLTGEHFGSAAEPNLLFTHGFGQNRLSWRAAAGKLAEAGWNGLALDGRGHGDSAWSAHGAYAMDDFLGDLKLIAGTLSNKPILIGASMGGLLGLVAEAETLGGLFAALVLVDVTPRWEAAGVERIFSFMRAYPGGFADLAEAQSAVVQYLPHREQTDPNRLRAHLRTGADGRLHWHWDPRILSEIPMQPEQYQARMETAASKVRCPLLLLSGAKSDVVSAATISAFQALAPHAQHRSIARATHMVVGDQNDQFTSEILQFLSNFS
jgi:pimeloyl-ACP methyl ester carboxylesterase